MAAYTLRKTCRVCGSKDLVKFLDLGEMPLANSLIKEKDLNEKESKYPLTVVFCKKCSLVQVPDVVDPKILFSNYYYITSTSPQLIEHFKGHAKNVRKFIDSKDDLVVDIGGNDGTLLKELKKDCRVLNVEPAKNIAKISRKKGIETINGFFVESVDKIIKKHGHAKVITANNVIAHTDSVRELFKGVKKLLADDGVFIFETHWVGNLIGKGGFDQIYHEHLSYFSLHSLKYLTDSLGLKIFDVKLVPLNGESLQVYVSKNRKVGKSVEKFLAKEKKIKLNKFEAYSQFSKKVLENRRELVKLIFQIRRKGKYIAGYGASAKGSTLLNYFFITRAWVSYITDTSPLKQGMYMPGVHIPIYHPGTLYERLPDYILLLAWNYADSILKKEKKLRKAGVKFIIPVPQVKIV